MAKTRTFIAVEAVDGVHAQAQAAIVSVCGRSLRT